MSADEPDAEGVVGTWFVNHGETVVAGQVVAEVQVDKVSREVEATVAGVLHHVVAEGAGVRQGEPVATID
jgi:pyruvate/2-oxoglutarate dehydrogenase complex dihydrolipoamide acyltransferase (E2) component